MDKIKYYNLEIADIYNITYNSEFSVTVLYIRLKTAYI